MNNKNKLILKSTIVAAIVAIAFAFFMGVLKIPIINLQLARMSTLTYWDFGFLAIFSMLSGTAYYVYQQKKSNKSLAAGTTGFLAGFVTAMCPVCPLLIFALFGASATLSFLAPYYSLIRGLSVILLAAGIYMAAKDTNCKNCKIK